MNIKAGEHHSGGKEKKPTIPYTVHPITRALTQTGYRQ